MKMKSLVCSCALMVGLAGVAQAHEDVNNDGKFTLLFGAGKYLTDSSRDIDHGDVGEIGFGYIIDKHWAVEAVYSQINGVDSDDGNDGDADMFRVDGLYHFDKNGHWTPYLAAGIGAIDFDIDNESGGDGATLNFGGGVKYALSKELSVRADVRAIYAEDDSDLDGLATIGFNYIFGAESSVAEPIIAEPTVVEPAVKPLDLDGDGVPYAVDRCLNTPAGVAVNSKGCPLDSDLDGVPNYLDKCHSTRRDVKVDRDGCPGLGSDVVNIELEVLFDTDKSDIKPEFMAEIQRVAEFMNQYKDSYAVIKGHTDSVGDAPYNEALSQRRADAVRAVLVTERGINSERITSQGFGEKFPRAGNATRDGRQLNRRVVATLKSME